MIAIAPVKIAAPAIPYPRKPVRYNLAPSDKAEIETELQTYRVPTDEETEAALERWLAFARKCSIKSGRKTVKFDPYEFQKKLFRDYWKHPLLVVGKPRQHGLTETIANIFLWQASEGEAFSAALFSKGQKDTKKIARRVKRMAMTHGDIELDRANDEEISVVGGGILYFLNAKPNDSRSLESLSCLLLDEAAFVDKAEEIWGAATGAQAMLGDAAKQVIVSTPPPPEDDPDKQTFYIKMLTADNGDRDVVRIANQMRAGEVEPVQSWTDESGACKFLVHWKAHPVYSAIADHLERIMRRLKISKPLCNREHDLAFDERLDTGIIDLEWFSRYGMLDLPSDPIFVMQSWDTASSTRKKSSHSAGLTLIFDAGYIYIADMVHKQLLSPDVETAIREAANKWRPNIILIEDKSSGIHIIPSLQRDSMFRYAVKAVPPFTVKGEPGNAKLLRFEQELPKIRDERRVLIPEDLRSPAWVGIFKSSMARVGIPRSSMDIADALSQALRYWRVEYTENSRSDRAGFGMRLGGQQRRYGYL